MSWYGPLRDMRQRRLYVCMCGSALGMTGRQMIPMKGMTAGGNSGEINTSVFGKAEAERFRKLGKPQNVTCLTFTNTACFPVANFTALP